MLTKCFVYGTLMSPEVLQALIGRVPAMCKPAFLPKYTRHPVKGVCYPGIIPVSTENDVSKDGDASSDQIGVEGILLTGLSQEELDKFDWFEAEDYTRSVKQISVTKILDKPKENGENTITQMVDANVYIWCCDKELLDLKRDWNYDKFRQTKLDWYLKSTVRPENGI